MADVCIVYLAEDEGIVKTLVFHLRKHWDTWWARDLAHGDWELAVRTTIRDSTVVVPVLSVHAHGERMTIMKDEMRYAKKQGKPILPFIIGSADVPFGFGDLTHIEAHGWTGAEDHPSFQQLKAKIAATFDTQRPSPPPLKRAQELTVRGKVLRLPSFVFSVSSHETQVMPKDGVTLLHLLGPGATLVSAYDAWKHYRRGRDRDFRARLNSLRRSKGVFFLDSGNYEAHRKNDRRSPKKNPGGWNKDSFREMASILSPDVVFSFDRINPTGEPDQIVARIVSDFCADRRALPDDDISVYPIIHLPRKHSGTVSECASKIVSGVAAALKPAMIAIPERELGDGLMQRAKTTRDIRRALDALGTYYPLHLLGTGNPLSMIALAAAGADSFDGLEWCRTVADCDNGFLFHFQHFDFFRDARIHRVRDHRIRRLIENPRASYGARVLSYNVDFFMEWTKTMQSMIHAGQVETLLKMVPTIGYTLFRELAL